MNSFVNNLKVNSRRGFFVVDSNPEFSWNIVASIRREYQTRYAVCVATTLEKAQSGEFDVWYSGDFIGNKTKLVYGAEGGINATEPDKLKPGTQYYWFVLVANRDGVRLPVTEIGSFETGLFGDFGESNKWIEAREPQNPIDNIDLTLAASLFRKQFTLLQNAENIDKARLYATAAGNHIMYINGSRAGNDYMAPGKSQCTTLLYYQTYDVTKKLQSGDNTISAEVGQGWYNAGSVGDDYGTNTGLKAKLIITFKDGKQQIIDTDSTWLGTKEGPTICNRYYIGQLVDANRKIKGFAENNCKSDRLLPVKATDIFVARKKESIPDVMKNVIGDTDICFVPFVIANNFTAEIMEPVTAVKSFHPISYEKISENKFIYKLEQNIAGTLRITATAPNNTKISITYSEYPDGNIVPYLGHNGKDVYIFSGTGVETVEFNLVYHGFQYIIIEGFEGVLPLENIEALALSSLSERASCFECSNSEMNQFFENTMWTLRSNFVSTITDCPTREKNSWAGDAQIISATSTYFFNTYGNYYNFEEMMKCNQNIKGNVGVIIPGKENVNNFPDSNNTSMPVWSDAIVIIPWNMYLAYGTESILSQNYEAMKKYMCFVINNSTFNITDSTAEKYYIREGHSYGDWLGLYRGNRMRDENQGYFVHDKSRGYEKVETHYEDLGTAYAAYISDILSKTAKKLGKTEDAEYFADASQKYAAAWRKEWLMDDGITPKSHSHTSYALGLYYNLYEKKNMLTAAAKLAEQIKADDYMLTSGFVGVNCIFKALTNNGQSETAFKLFFNDSKRSLLHALRLGATTVPEDIAHFVGNHFCFGTASGWIFGNVLGIGESDVDNAGYLKFTLAPTYNVENGVTWAKGSYRSAAGEIVSDWKLSDDGKAFTLKCKIPCNSKAVIALPITSKNNIITEGGKAAKDAEGLEFIEFKNGRAYFSAASGEYNFTINY